MLLEGEGREKVFKRRDEKVIKRGLETESKQSLNRVDIDLKQSKREKSGEETYIRVK